MSRTCVSCGSRHNGTKRNCSMCYGDLDYGGCTRYREEMERDAEREQAREREASDE